LRTWLTKTEKSCCDSTTGCRKTGPFSLSGVSFYLCELIPTSAAQ
jgi:hypothetical protein